MTRGLYAGSRLAVAVGRFDPDGPHGYRAATMPDAPLRTTRIVAEHDERQWLSVGIDETARDNDAEALADLGDVGDLRWDV